MKNFTKVLSFLGFLLLSSFGSLVQAQENTSQTAYKGATLFDGTGKKFENSIIIVKEGKIVDVGGEDTSIPADTDIVDLSGKYITPGLIDAHVHLSATGLFDTRPTAIEFDFVDSLNYLAAKAFTKNNIEKYYEAYLRSGVTGVYDNGGVPWTINLQETAEHDLNAPHVAAAGPLITNAPESFLSFINPTVEKEMVRLTSDSLGRKIVQYNTYMGSTGIKILGMPIDNNEFINSLKVVADEVDKLENKLIVHTYNLEEAKVAVKMGAKLLVHSISDKIVDDEFLKLMKQKNAIYTPNLAPLDFIIPSLNALLGNKVEIKDPNKVIDKRTLNKINNPEEYVGRFDTLSVQGFINYFDSPRYKSRDSLKSVNLKEIWQAGIPITVGTDAGNPGAPHGLSYHYELEKMQEAGIPPTELIIMATRNGAMAMERLDDFGTLEVDKMADLIILQKDPSQDISNMRSITHVMRGGLLRSVAEKFN